MRWLGRHLLSRRIRKKQGPASRLSKREIWPRLIWMRSWGLMGIGRSPFLPLMPFQACFRCSHEGERKRTTFISKKSVGSDVTKQFCIRARRHRRIRTSSSERRSRDQLCESRDPTHCFGRGHRIAHPIDVDCYAVDAMLQ